MKKIKILFWKMLLKYNNLNIKISFSDLKIFEKRALRIEERLTNLGVYGVSFEELEYIKNDIKYTKKLSDFYNDKEIHLIDEIGYGYKGSEKDE